MSITGKKTLAELLENSHKLYPERPALAYAGKEPYTFSEVYSKSKSLSNLLASRGIIKGDKVILLAQNMPEWGIAYLAVTSMAAVIVPILTDFSPAEVKKIVDHSEASAIIVSDRLSAKITGSTFDGIHTVILLDNLTLLDIDEFWKGKLKTAEISDNQEAVLAKPEENDLAAILYTSGTTGSPKGVMLSHINLISNAINTGEIQDVLPNDRMLSVLPLPHTYECTIGFIIPMMNGASVYYLDKPPTAAVLVPAMKLVKPTMMLTVPLIMEKIYKLQIAPKFNKSPITRALFKTNFFRKLFHKIAGKKLYKTFGGNLKFYGIGGAKLAADAELFLRDAGFPYAIGYGLTETSPLLAGCTPSITKYRSTGYPLPNQELRIDNPNPVTGEGEIVARGPNIMLGYYKDEEKTKEVFTPDGWFRTGDLGVIDNDNYLYIKGRLKNMILGPSGENIYPEEIETLINNQSMVVESLVYEMKGKLFAKVHLNYEELENYYQDIKQQAKDMQTHMGHIISDKLNEIKTQVNREVSKFSRLAGISEHDKPFEKTPTQKIKRFLYQPGKNEKK